MVIALFILVEQSGNYLPLLKENLVLRGREPIFFGIVRAQNCSALSCLFCLLPPGKEQRSALREVRWTLLKCFSSNLYRGQTYEWFSVSWTIARGSREKLWGLLRPSLKTWRYSPALEQPTPRRTSWSVSEEVVYESQAGNQASLSSLNTVKN